LVKVGGI